MQENLQSSTIKNQYNIHFNSTKIFSNSTNKKTEKKVQNHLLPLNPIASADRVSIIRSCCQLCDECENSNNTACCCDADTCHSVFIQCNTPGENTDWFISRNDTNGKRPSFIKITKNVFVEKQMKAELNISISTVEKGDKTMSVLRILNPNYRMFRRLEIEVKHDWKLFDKYQLEINGTEGS